eukprot:TRINITY_DN21625_c0_g1_i2.p1 TRINITY_DN21625_c0_g1~~TRINITY_DN21625_c0_g1_i2.p1  ORF type:complete len:304 (-),score=56.03 TRINITY_DN21625_c0_g1_i2:105-908(-)
MCIRDRDSMHADDAIVTRAAEAVAEPTQGTCNLCKRVKQQAEFSNKQWKRVRALLMGRGGHGGCCIGCTGARVQQAQRQDISATRSQNNHSTQIYSHLMCAGCKNTFPADAYAKFNNEEKHPLGHNAFNCDDVLAEQPELPTPQEVAHLTQSTQAHFISKVLCRACTHEKKRLKIVVRGLNTPQAVESLINKKIDKLLQGDVWERKLLHVWVPDDEYAELTCTTCQRLFRERKLADKGDFGILLSIASFKEVELVDSYLFGRYLVLK